MKSVLPALTALVALCAAAPAFAVTPSHGSTVLIPPLIVKGAAASKSVRPLIVTLPTQAGNVSKMVATNLVAKGPSWIAKGDHYFSLCVPNRRLVACAPIVATSVMNDIEVGAVVAKDGTPRLTFKMAPTAKPARAMWAINYFLTRTNKQVAHFNRMAVSYAPAPRQNSLQVGSTSNAVMVPSGGDSCSYDDENSYDCSGGDSGGSGGSGGIGDGGRGGSGGNGNGEPIPGPSSPPDPTPDPPTGGCEGICNYPPNNNNGNDDPCIGPDGVRICASPDEIPKVPVNGERPAPEEPMSLPTCTAAGPFTIECGRLPPVVGGEPDQLPRAPTPWFPQSWCDNFQILCSAGQEPSDSGKTYDELLQECEDAHTAATAYCDKNENEMAPRMVEVCYSKADRASLTCRERARNLTGAGAHVVP